MIVFICLVFEFSNIKEQDASSQEIVPLSKSLKKSHNVVLPLPFQPYIRLFRSKSLQSDSSHLKFWKKRYPFNSLILRRISIYTHPFKNMFRIIYFNYIRKVLITTKFDIFLQGTFLKAFVKKQQPPNSTLLWGNHK